MLRFEDGAERVAYDDRPVKNEFPRRTKVSKPRKAKVSKTPRSHDLFGMGAKDFNDEIPDPDFAVPE